MPPGALVTVELVIGLGPGSTGGVQLTLADPIPAVAVAPVGGWGAPGVVVGTTALEGADGGPVPAVLVAVTVKGEETPGVKPLTVVDGPAVEAVMPPGELVTV